MLSISNPLVERAYNLAEYLHQGQIRKGTGLPYFSEHLVKVAEIVENAGGSEKAIAAALLHDTIEDQPSKNPRQLIEEQCGSEVLSIVLECTEIGPGGEDKAPWLQRKQSYLSHLNVISASALLVSVADKLQSARDDLACHVENRGDDAYNIFKKAGRDTMERKANTLWFHRSLVEAFRMRIDVLRMSNEDSVLDGIAKLIEEFNEVVSWLEQH